jgi:NitT/TauT family transport system substrate-binding protein
LKKSLISIPIVLAIIVGAVFVLLPTENNSSEPLKIGISTWPGYSLAFLAQEKGFFEENGVNVELVHTQEYTDAQTSFLNKEVDGVFQVYTDSIFYSSTGVDSKVVYVVNYSTESDVVVGFGDVKGLKGKTIGIESLNGFSHLFVLKALEKNGLTENDVNFKIVPAHQIVDSLISGDIDAGHTWDPTKESALDEGFEVICTAGDLPGIITDVLSFNSKITEQRPDEVQAVIASLQDAKQYYEQNPDESIKIMAEKLGIDSDDLSNGYQGIHLLSHDENLESLLGNDETRSLRGTGDFIANYYLERGQLSQMPNFDEIIDPTPLQNLDSGV